MPAKKVPMRMCVGCREMKPKKELLRIVRSPEGELCVDRTGKVSGRGAYICANAECLNRARKIKALERALEHGIEDEVFSRLASEITGDAE